MERVFGNWLHWSGYGWHAGFQKHGNCWRFKFHKQPYHTCTVYTFWRFFISFDKPSQKKA